ncbi:hypothetical protein KJ815_13675 [bacterium]|nr:hypothetical protein [bacterium]
MATKQMHTVLSTNDKTLPQLCRKVMENLLIMLYPRFIRRTAMLPSSIADANGI